MDEYIVKTESCKSVCPIEKIVLKRKRAENFDENEEERDFKSDTSSISDNNNPFSKLCHVFTWEKCAAQDLQLNQDDDPASTKIVPTSTASKNNTDLTPIHTMCSQSTINKITRFKVGDTVCFPLKYICTRSEKVEFSGEINDKSHNIVIEGAISHKTHNEIVIYVSPIGIYLSLTHDFFAIYMLHPFGNFQSTKNSKKSRNYNPTTIKGIKYYSVNDMCDMSNSKNNLNKKKTFDMMCKKVTESKMAVNINHIRKIEALLNDQRQKQPPPQMNHHEFSNKKRKIDNAAFRFLCAKNPVPQLQQ